MIFKAQKKNILFEGHAKFINCTQIKKKVTSRNVPRNCLPS